MKKYLAEMVGTMVLVLMGCGSAIFNGGEALSQLWDHLLELPCLPLFGKW